ncbi:MAG: transglycosylase SLT domain-containing protein [Vulcanimicrobiota bacterium]
MAIEATNLTPTSAPAAPASPTPKDGAGPARPEARLPELPKDVVEIGQKATHWLEEQLGEKVSPQLKGLIEGLHSWLGGPTRASSQAAGPGPVAPSNPSLTENARVVAEVARAKGVDPRTALATMLIESGGNARAVGDNGSSFGLFQLHRGGELGNLTPEQAFDARTNAEVALTVFAQNRSRYSDPGELAAASQRPADRAEYQRRVNARLEGQARC